MRRGKSGGVGGCTGIGLSMGMGMGMGMSMGAGSMGKVAGGLRWPRGFRQAFFRKDNGKPVAVHTPLRPFGTHAYVISPSGECNTIWNNDARRQLRKEAAAACYERLDGAK